MSTHKVTDGTATIGAISCTSDVACQSVTVSSGVTASGVITGTSPVWDNATLQTIKAFSISTTVAAGTTGVETDGAYDLPDQAVVYDVFVNVTAASTGTTKTLDIGILSTSSGGDVDGFLDGVSTSSTGIRRGLSSTLGSYLTATAGTTDAAAQRLVFPTDSITAKSMVYQSGTTGDGEGLTADIFVTLATLA